MPLRAFFDSDASQVYRPETECNGVLMPLRAFFDSDLRHRVVGQELERLNALAGVF